MQVAQREVEISHARFKATAAGAWGLMLCRWNRVGLLYLPSPGISAAVLCAGPGRWGMKGIFILAAAVFPTFAASLGRYIKILIYRC